jgi:membrane protease YdiL (CAAX protease family)
MNKLFSIMNKNALIGLLVFLGFPFILKLLPLNLVLQELAMWLLLVLIVLWIYFIEKKTIASIGWKKLKLKTIFAGIGIGLILFIIFGISNVVIQAMGLELNQGMAKLLADQPMPFLILIALRAGIVEEVLFRGYAFERINDLTKSKFLAGLIPLIVFTLAHLAWGVGHLLFVFIAGALFTILYVAKRNLALVIIAHFTVDVIALIVLPMLLASQ